MEDILASTPPEALDAMLAGTTATVLAVVGRDLPSLRCPAATKFGLATYTSRPVTRARALAREERGIGVAAAPPGTEHWSRD